MPEELLTVTRDIEAAPEPGWVYTVPQTGTTLRAKWAKELRALVRKHMEANGVPIPDDFDVFINDAACRESGLGAPFCGKMKRRQVPEGVPVDLSFAHVAKFLRAVKYALIERKFVSPDEAHRRVGICMNCPLATDVGDCATCFGVSKLVKFGLRFVTKFGIEVPKEKRVCGACGCSISIKSILPMTVLKKVDAKENPRPNYHSDCWMREA